MQRLYRKRIVLGVGGGIAAYKSAELVRRLLDQGAEVRVVMTRGGSEFITPLTMQALSGHPVHLDLLDPAAEAAMGHIELAKWADLVLIAPATADLIARLAQGLANDLLTTLVLATDATVAIAPAMNQAMWRDPATQANTRLLESRGLRVFGPASGSQACGDVGFGRMLEADDLVSCAAECFQRQVLSYAPAEFLGDVQFDHRIAVVEEECEAAEADQADAAEQVAELRVETDPADRRFLDKDHSGKRMFKKRRQARSVQVHPVARVAGRRILGQKDVDRVHLLGDRLQAQVLGHSPQEEHELVQIGCKGNDEHYPRQQDQKLKPVLGLSYEDHHNGQQGKKQRDRQLRHEDADHDDRQPRRPEEFVTAVAEYEHQARHKDNNPVEIVPVTDVE